jgi:hypothetical protein
MLSSGKSRVILRLTLVTILIPLCLPSKTLTLEALELLVVHFMRDDTAIVIFQVYTLTASTTAVPSLG